jgi:hypothetical protein
MGRLTGETVHALTAKLPQLWHGTTGTRPINLWFDCHQTDLSH